MTTWTPRPFHSMSTTCPNQACVAVMFMDVALGRFGKHCFIQPCFPKLPPGFADVDRPGIRVSKLGCIHLRLSSSQVGMADGLWEAIFSSVSTIGFGWYSPSRFNLHVMLQ